MNFLDHEFYIYLGAILRKARNAKQYSLEEVAIRVNKTKKTIQRYEVGEVRLDVNNLNELCKVLDLDVGEVLNQAKQESSKNYNPSSIPFTTAEDAMAFILKAPSVSAYGGYDIEKMSDEEIIEFANDILSMIQIVGSKYKK